MKVPFFDKKILRTFYAFLGGISVITSIVFLFVGIDNKVKLPVGLVVLGIIVLVYIGLWVHAKKRQSINLKINTSEVEVKFGDIFAEAADLKAIAFNEYFDTIVDDKIIARGSLHGQYIEKFYKDNVSALDSFISSDAYLPGMIAGEDVDRPVGKKTRYKLGTICQVATICSSPFRASMVPRPTLRLTIFLAAC